jgi:hypothetical protein
MISVTERFPHSVGIISGKATKSLQTKDLGAHGERPRAGGVSSDHQTATNSTQEKHGQETSSLKTEGETLVKGTQDSPVVFLYIFLFYYLTTKTESRGVKSGREIRSYFLLQSEQKAFLMEASKEGKESNPDR